jgi:uncharacterized repeat protein (TIGR03803 family)
MRKVSRRNTGIGCAALLIFTVVTIAAPAQVIKTLVSFDGANGANAVVNLVQGIDGYLYGTTFLGGNGTGCIFGSSGSGCGTVFKISSAGSLETLYSFCNQTNCTDGENPSAGLVQATDGNFYGTTGNGGANGPHGFGTVFRITPSGTLTTLYSFCNGGDHCADGSNPEAGLAQASDGNFYGTTQSGGAYDKGTVFKITAEGILTTLHSFCSEPNCADAYSPEAGLVQGADGKLYGTTYLGGSGAQGCNGGCGTVFDITLRGDLTTIHDFHGTDGYGPQGTALIQATDGNFYGTTPQGGRKFGDVSPGTLFRMTPGGGLTTLYDFCSQPNCADGDWPYGALAQGSDGNLYGTTSDAQGGYGAGTVFKITPSGPLTTLYHFCSQPNCADGANPDGGLVQATDGEFYGTTYQSGNLACGNGYGCGTVFSLDVGLGPFVAFVRPYGKVGQTGGILGQGFTGTTSVMLNGTPANFTVVSDTYLTATVPPGATTGYVTVTTPTGVLTSNVPFRVIP